MASSGSSGGGAGSKRSRDDIEDLTCSICSDLFQAPVTLPSCGHTFCCYCIQRWFRSPSEGNNNRKCPTCRAKVKLASWPPSVNVSLGALSTRAERDEEETSKDDLTSRLLRNVGAPVTSAGLASRITHLLSRGASAHATVGSDSALLVACRDGNDPAIAKQLLASLPSGCSFAPPSAATGGGKGKGRAGGTGLGAADAGTASRALRHAVMKGAAWKDVAQGLQERGAVLPEGEGSDEDGEDEDYLDEEEEEEEEEDELDSYEDEDEYYDSEEDYDEDEDEDEDDPWGGYHPPYVAHMHLPGPHGQLIPMPMGGMWPGGEEEDSSSYDEDYGSDSDDSEDSDEEEEGGETGGAGGAASSARSAPAGRGRGRGAARATGPTRAGRGRASGARGSAARGTSTGSGSTRAAAACAPAGRGRGRGARGGASESRGATASRGRRAANMSDSAGSSRGRAGVPGMIRPRGTGRAAGREGRARGRRS